VLASPENATVRPGGQKAYFFEPLDGDDRLTRGAGPARVDVELVGGEPTKPFSFAAGSAFGAGVAAGAALPTAVVGIGAEGKGSGFAERGADVAPRGNVVT
jgi:hypothetical protein